MKSSSQPDSELRNLVDHCLNGSLCEVSRFRLEQRLQTEKSALDYYLEMAANEALIAPALADGMTAERFAKLHQLHPRAREIRHRVLAIAAVVALLATAAALISRHAASSPRPVAVAAAVPKSTHAIPARITGRVGVRMAGNNDDLTLAERPTERTIDLAAGLLEITFDQGANLVLEGPAKLEVTGPNSCILAHGRAVAKVPPAAMGFTVAYLDGHLVDHGTEFALNVAPDGKASDVGVFKGEVEIFDKQQPRGVQLFTDYAVKMTAAGPVSTKFDRGRYTREMPTREFSWDMTGIPLDQRKDFHFDITPLMHGPGTFRVVFRNFSQLDGITIHHVEIRRDGQMVNASDAIGYTYNFPGRFNDYQMTVPAGDWRPGHWELAFHCTSPSDGRPPRYSNSQGIVCFEEGLSVHATATDFLGRWTYSHHGVTYTRIIRQDGTAVMERNGQEMPPSYFDGKWSVDDGVLTIRFSNGVSTPEKHILRDRTTLIFLSNPYRNARRDKSAENQLPR